MVLCEFLVLCQGNADLLRANVDVEFAGHVQREILLALVTILAESLFTLVSGHLVSLVLLTVGHSFYVFGLTTLYLFAKMRAQRYEI